jgi:hypothetical protein
MRLQIEGFRELDMIGQVNINEKACQSKGAVVTANEIMACEENRKADQQAKSAAMKRPQKVHRGSEGQRQTAKNSGRRTGQAILGSGQTSNQQTRSVRAPERIRWTRDLAGARMTVWRVYIRGASSASHRTRANGWAIASYLDGHGK